MIKVPRLENINAAKDDMANNIDLNVEDLGSTEQQCSPYCFNHIDWITNMCFWRANDLYGMSGATTNEVQSFFANGGPINRLTVE